MAPFTQYAIAAARQALTDAEWTPNNDVDKERTVKKKFKYHSFSSLILIISAPRCFFLLGCLYWIWYG